MFAADFETMTHGGNRKNGQHAPVRVDRKTAAASLNVSERTVSNAAAVKKRGTPELQQSVRDGAIPVKPAAELARKSAAEQRKGVQEAKAKKAAAQRSKAAPKKRGKAVSEDEDYHRHEGSRCAECQQLQGYRQCLRVGF
jgi:hypothetical protein